MNATRQTVLWMGAIVALEICSRLTIFHPLANASALIIISLAVFLVTIFRPSFGYAVLAIEFLIGSKGALLQAGISLRVALFIAFFFGWLVWALRHQTWRSWRTYLVGRKAYLALAALLAYAFLLGWFRQQQTFLFVDANAWGMWLLLLPALDLARHDRERLGRVMIPAVLAALLWLPIKTLAVFYLFSHGLAAVGDPLYLWIRRTGVGEVTRVIGTTHRVFFQSQIYAVFVIIATLLKPPTPLSGGLGLLALATIVVALSRSFLVGLFAGLLVAFGLLLCDRVIRKRETHLGQALSHLLVISVGAILLIVAILYAPPARPVSVSDFLGSRFQSGESAIVSRWQLLPALWTKILEHPIMGSGFGATVTYQSQDPRVLAMTGGAYTTYAFEWGWLEHWLKFGIFGIPLMAWIVWSLVWRIWKAPRPREIRYAWIASLAALAVTHFFTPYLNHPLGFFVLITGEMWLERGVDNIAS